MKKIFALLIISILSISLVACKGNTSDYIGVWETENYRLTINKGGIGEYRFLTEDRYYNLDWEVKDGVLITKISGFGMEYKTSLELNKDKSSLVVTQMGFPIYNEEETEFKKQP